MNARFSFITNTALALLLLAMCLRGNAGELTLDAKPHGLIGLDVGPSMHTGRTHVVDGITGATLPDKEDSWTQYAISPSLFLDLGFPTSPRGLKGTVGMRFSAGASFPGPFFDLNALARYRFKLDIGSDGKYTAEPWMGIGMGFHFRDQISSSLYMQLPIAAGCDFQLSKKGLLLTTALQLNTLNPVGPTYLKNVNGNEQWHKPRWDSYVLKIGLAWRFY